MPQKMLPCWGNEEILVQHQTAVWSKVQWYSGNIHVLGACVPGSIPGWTLRSSVIDCPQYDIKLFEAPIVQW